jgi:hypothetical protein
MYNLDKQVFAKFIFLFPVSVIRSPAAVRRSKDRILLFALTDEWKDNVTEFLLFYNII